MLKVKTTIVTLFLIFTLAPIYLFAQDFETIISADQIIVEPGNILIARGNLSVKRGKIYVKAEEMTIDGNNEQIKFKNITEYYDGNSTKLVAESAVLSQDLSIGIVSAAQVLIDETLRIRAEKIELKNNTIERASNIDRVTSCKECENALPLWYFTASSARNDVVNQNIIYRDVTLRVRGVPVGYIPYLRLPNPNVNRARGFLIPGLIVSSNLGTGVKLPYFIPIGDSKDLLLTLYISPKTKTTEYRYRQKMNSGEIEVRGAFSNDNITDTGIRNYFRAKGVFKLGYGLDFNIKAGRVDDESYLNDYSFGEASDLNTNIKISKSLVDEKRLFDGQLSYVRDTRNEGSVDEFYLLTGIYNRRIDQSVLPGNMILETMANSALNINQSNQVSRPPSSISTGLGYSYKRNVGSFEILDQQFARVTSFVNPENVENLKEYFIFQYGLSSQFSFPVYKKKNNWHHSLSPKVVLSYNDQVGQTTGDFFVGGDQLSFGNIYSAKKYSSSSESELGLSASAGVEYRVNWADGHIMEFSFGGLWQESATKIQSKYSGLGIKNFNYIAKFRYNNEDISVYGSSLFDNHADILNADISANLSIKEFDIAGAFDFIDARNDERLLENLKSLELSTSYAGFENLNFSLARRFNIRENSMSSSYSNFNLNISSGFWGYKLSQTLDSQNLEKTSISAVYNDDCTKVTFSLQNTSQNITEFEDIQSISVLLQLKPFTGFSLPSLN